MSDFEKKLKNAIDRGIKRGQYASDEAAREKANLERLKTMHTSLRLSLSEYIETVVRKLSDYLPGFRFETVFGDNGWGAACWSDQLSLSRGARSSNYSRFELAIKPHNEYNVLDLKARGTISNRELLTRSFYAPLDEVDEEHFKHLIDSWALSFAELYSAKQNS